MPVPDNKPTQRLWSLWLLATLAPVMYAVAGLVVSRGGGIDVEPSTRRIIGVVLFVVAVGDTLGAIFLARIIAAVTVDVVSWCLLRWIVAQSPGLMGLVYLVFGGPWTASGALMGWTVLLMLYLAPGKTMMDRYDRLVEGPHP